MIDYLMLPLAVLPFPDIDPVIVQIGPLAIHWYGVGYVIGILFAWWYTKRLVTTPRLWPDGVTPMRPDDVDDFLVWAAIGVVLGGRIGYILFYDLARYIARKGSVAVDGVSLTVNGVEGNRFTVNLIPHTLAHTNFDRLHVGAAVNIEIDLLARYVERMNAPDTP